MAENEKREPLTPAAARGLRCDLKGTLADISNGRGGLGELLNQIERVIKQIAGKPNATMRESQPKVTLFVCRHALDRIADTGMPGVSFDRLYDATTEARNDFCHTGTRGALASACTEAMAAVLMEALASAAETKDGQAVRDIMVSNPVCAHNWQSLADLRRTMLVNDYSVLPISDGQCGDGWLCVRAEDLAMHMRSMPRGRAGETLGESRSAKSCAAINVVKVTAVQEKSPVKRVSGRRPAVGTGRSP